MSDENSETPSPESSPRVKSDRGGRTKGIIVLLLCAALIAATIFVVKNHETRELPNSHDARKGPVRTDSSSSSWTCPVIGSAQNSDSIFVANVDTKRTAPIVVSSYDDTGLRLGEKKLTLKANTSNEIMLSTLKLAEKTSVFVDSYASSVLVFRSVTLSDGTEFLPCQAQTTKTAVFTGLETIRDTNSDLVLSNPYDEAIVVDITARLVDSTVDPPRSLIDEARGRVVPEHGQYRLNLESEFGRFSEVGLEVTSRSGFFVAETLLTYTGGENASGQTIIIPSPQLTTTHSIYAPGVDPTRTVFFNNGDDTHSVQATALAFDKRAFAGGAESVLPGTLAKIGPVGTDFGIRTIGYAIEKGPKDPKQIYGSWVHASEGNVTSGIVGSVVGRTAVLYVSKTGALALYNNSNSDQTVSISNVGSTKSHEISLSAKSTSTISSTDAEIETDSLVVITSRKPISVATYDSSQGAYSTGIIVSK